MNSETYALKIEMSTMTGKRNGARIPQFWLTSTIADHELEGECCKYFGSTSSNRQESAHSQDSLDHTIEKHGLSSSSLLECYFLVSFL